MGRCRYINKYNMTCGASTCNNHPYCSLHTSIQKMKDEGTWEDIQKKSKDKDYDPYKGLGE